MIHGTCMRVHLATYSNAVPIQIAMFTANVQIKTTLASAVDIMLGVRTAFLRTRSSSTAAQSIYTSHA